jgi:hypothetical protein
MKREGESVRACQLSSLVAGAGMNNRPPIARLAWHAHGPEALGSSANSIAFSGQDLVGATEDHND